MFEDELSQRPVIVAIAGSNGAGKSTFYTTYWKQTNLPFINADVIANARGIDAYAAAEVAESLRRNYLSRHESFVFETVLSDPVGAKVDFLAEAVESGFHVVFCFIALRDAEASEQRVNMRVTQGGHDVPAEKILERHPRTLTNLKLAIRILPRVKIYDNSDLNYPFQLVAVYRDGRLASDLESLPDWLRDFQ